MRSIGGRLVDADAEPVLHGALERMCALSGVPVPKLAVMEARDPNAFAFGRSRQHAVIVVTRPLVDLLEPDELEAVLAHELAHLAHRDLLVMSLASSPRILKSAFSGLILDASNAGTGLIGLVGWAFTAVLDLVCYLPMRLLSRYRELCADAAAAQLTHRPGSLASALQKIAGGTNLIPSKDIRSSALVDTFGIVASAEHASGGLTSTHPSLERRMAQLARIGAELGRPTP
jgi:heat shock protein HtpX